MGVGTKPTVLDMYTITVIAEEAGNTLQVIMNSTAEIEDDAIDEVAEKFKEYHPLAKIKGYKVYERNS